MLTAGLFLQDFVKDETPWRTRHRRTKAFNESAAHGYTPKGWNRRRCAHTRTRLSATLDSNTLGRPAAANRDLGVRNRTTEARSECKGGPTGRLVPG